MPSAVQLTFSSLLSASQLGVTLASLGLGWVAEAAFSGIIGDALGALPFAIQLSLRITIAAAVALAAVTYLHVVFGELAPKGAALVHPEALARWFVPPLMVLGLADHPVHRPPQSLGAGGAPPDRT